MSIKMEEIKKRDTLLFREIKTYRDKKGESVVIDLPLSLILVGFTMCGLLLHHITILSVRYEQTKSASTLTYILASVATLWFTPLFLSIKLAILLGNGDFGIPLWLILSISGLSYTIVVSNKLKHSANNTEMSVVISKNIF
jgi:hypothetical protein